MREEEGGEERGWEMDVDLDVDCGMFSRKESSGGGGGREGNGGLVRRLEGTIATATLSSDLAHGRTGIGDTISTGSKGTGNPRAKRRMAAQGGGEPSIFFRAQRLRIRMHDAQAQDHFSSSNT